MMLDIFANVQISTKYWTLDPLVIAEILQRIQGNPKAFPKILFLLILGSQILKGLEVCVPRILTIWNLDC